MPETNTPWAVEPTNNAGLSAADPPQDNISQDPSVAVIGDIDQFPTEA